MRFPIPALALAAALCAAPAALAAPTCQTRAGDTVRCGTPGAMPVGWTLPPGQMADRDAARPQTSVSEILAPLGVVCWLFAVIALMPRFDGWGAGEWGRQEEEE